MVEGADENRYGWKRKLVAEMQIDDTHPVHDHQVVRPREQAPHFRWDGGPRPYLDAAVPTVVQMHAPCECTHSFFNAYHRARIRQVTTADSSAVWRLVSTVLTSCDSDP